MSRWRLDSAEARNRESPGSFFIPPRARRATLVPGDVVKLIFLVEGRDEERRWVEVVRVDGSEYAGRLVDEPERGDPVEFRPEHVAAVLVTEEEIGYDVDAYALVSRRIRDENERPTRVWRDPPAGRAEGGSDSGWRLAAAGDDAAFLSDPENCLWWDLGWISDKFPELEPLLRTGAEEGAWEWDEASAAYR